MNNELKQAEEKYQRAAESLMETVQTLYPLGSVVVAELGGHLIELRITGHSQSWWCEPNYLYGTNINTEKKRRFSVRTIQDNQ